MGENTLRALASDLAYLEAWAVRADRRCPTLADGRGDPLEVRLAKREAHRKHAMPQKVVESLREDGLLRSEGPYGAGDELATLHRWRGIEGPFASPTLRPALRVAVQASVRPPSSEEAARVYARRAGPRPARGTVGPTRSRS